MNRQEVFNTVAAHLLTQNRKSLSDYEGTHGFTLPLDGACAYRGNDGTKCAAGVLIKDEFYKTELEGKNVQNTLVQEALEASLGAPLSYDDSRFLKSLQLIHDDYPVAAWRQELAQFALQEGLVFADIVVPRAA